MRRVVGGRAPGTSGRAARAGGVRGARLVRALLFAAPALLGGCGALIGIDDVERTGDGAGASGGGAGAGPREGSGGASGRSGGGGTGGGPQEGAGGSGGGDPTGGSGGGDPTGGSGGGPVICDDSDPNGPNDEPFFGTELSDGFFTACDPVFSINDIHAFGDEDWFVAFGDDTDCITPPAPEVRLAPETGAEVCVFLESLDPRPLPITCVFPALLSFDGPPGTAGCCAPNAAKVSYPGRDAAIDIRIRPEVRDACVDYTLSFHY
ncbi:MAG TPA: hypothetical protein VFS43_28945 [Polyangiaceae bacterium]|nr:hypothetical protein [Polyangiaceae bacterium]